MDTDELALLIGQVQALVEQQGLQIAEIKAAFDNHVTENVGSFESVQNQIRSMQEDNSSAFRWIGELREKTEAAEQAALVAASEAATAAALAEAALEEAEEIEEELEEQEEQEVELVEAASVEAALEQEPEPENPEPKKRRRAFISI